MVVLHARVFSMSMDNQSSIPRLVHGVSFHNTEGPSLDWWCSEFLKSRRHRQFCGMSIFHMSFRRRSCTFYSVNLCSQILVSSFYVTPFSSPVWILFNCRRATQTLPGFLSLSHNHLQGVKRYRPMDRFPLIRNSGQTKPRITQIHNFVGLLFACWWAEPPAQPGVGCLEKDPLWSGAKRTSGFRIAVSSRMISFTISAAHFPPTSTCCLWNKNVFF